MDIDGATPDMVEVWHFETEIEAILAANRLCAFGIDAYAGPRPRRGGLSVRVFARADRVDEARAILEDMQRQPERDESLLPSDRMVVLARYPRVIEAELAVSALTARGIQAEVEPHAAYETLSHIQIGLNAQGVAVLGPEHLADEARGILAQIRGGDSDEEQQPLTELERRCRRAFFIAVGALLFLGPLGILSLLHTLSVKNVLNANLAQLSERQVTRCQVHLSFATIIGAVTPVFGSIVYGLAYFFATV
ncbi:MAG: hypothetical protein JXL80_08320 [Planctomycetes bacterium]|nr:hypothetical protein [Planctomycetota bacterium]